MTDVEMLLLALAAVAGAIVAALLGWGESHEPFEPRKFLSSLGRAVIAAVIVTVTELLLPGNNVTVKDYLYAFLVGGGVDVFGNRLAGAIGFGKKE